jgi:hypothetical protein
MSTPTMHGGALLGSDLVPYRTFDIGVDIDDVLHPWYEGSHRLCEAAGITNGVTPSSWKPYVEYGVEDHVWYDVLTRATLEGGLYDLPPIPGSVEALRRLMFLGHRIHLITARGFLNNGDLIRQHTHDWVAEFAVPHHSLVFAKDKPAEALRLELDFFADDGVHNFEALCHEAPKVRTYLIDAPHNQDFSTPFRLASLAEFAELIIEEGNKP